MAMQIDLALLGLIPFRIEEQVSCVTKLLDLLGVKFGPIRNSKGVIVGDFVFVDPVRNLVLMVILDVAAHHSAAEITIDGRPTTFLATLSRIRLSRGACRELLEDCSTSGVSY